ncbi:MAG TPA: hypothetical protein VHY18_14710 [Solirubrobacteraceae bacterium]|jgi:hypothetical protein|nr:hypothetical protein [Solirubrobacteraceae bacterium]
MNTSDEGQRSERPIRYVLVLCNHNAGPSQTAQAFFERRSRDTCELITAPEGS